MPTLEALERRKVLSAHYPEIRKLAAEGKTSTEMSAILGIRTQSIARICNRLGINRVKRAWTPRAQLPAVPGCPVNELRKAYRADLAFAALMGQRRFESAVEPPQPKWRRLPPVTTVVGSTSSMGGRYG